MPKEAAIIAVIGSVVGAVFGRVWLSWAGEGLPAWQTVLDVTGWVVTGAFVLAGAAVAARVLRAAPAPAAAEGAASRPRPHPAWFTLVIAVEVALVAVGNRLLATSLDLPHWSPAWTLLIVGVHFVPFALLLRVRAFHVLAAGMAAVAVLAVAAVAASGDTAFAFTVPGFGGAAALWIFPAWALTAVARGRWGARSAERA